MLLQDVVIVDLSQFLSGPSAGLRLADFGAEVIKIERPVTGDICRSLYVSDVKLEGESTIFHAINRNKKNNCILFNTAYYGILAREINKNGCMGYARDELGRFDKT